MSGSKTQEIGPRSVSAGVLSRTWTERRVLQLAVAIAVVSLPARLVNIDAPPLDLYDFRQAQTAITVQSFLDGNVSILHYQTPVFGPPWQVPFEFPLFQLSAFALAKLTGLGLDLVCRLTALLWFYASAWVLFVFLRRWAGLRIATAALAVYVLTPFSIQWSRAVLIDYASVALALAYLYLGLSWAARPTARLAAGAIAFGALAYVTKITSVIGVLAASLPFWLEPALGVVKRRRFSEPVRLVGLTLILVIPFLAGWSWTHWADSIKGAQPTTAMLTSERLHTWNFGTFAQRLSWANWHTVFVRVERWALPGALLLALPFGLISLVRSDAAVKKVVVGAVLGAFAPIMVFFNLYWVHDYYLIAVTPFLATIAGAGILYFIGLGKHLTGGEKVALASLALVVTVVTSKPSWKYLRLTYEVNHDSPLARLGRLVERNTEPGQWVAVQGDEWSSRILYEARRRGFMIWDGYTDITPLANRPEFGALVCKECPPSLLALFPRREFVGHESVWDVYRVWPEVAGSGRD